MKKLAICAVAGAMLFAGNAVAQNVNEPKATDFEAAAQTVEPIVDLEKNPNETNWWWWY
tara:strand:- start:2087 stop:2263 length:177 start_codon:yes stop_codon:yes gene_type:complete